MSPVSSTTAVTGSRKLEANKRLVQRYLDEIFNKKRYELIDEIIHPDFHCDPPSFPEPWNFNSYKEGVPKFQAAFSRFEWITEDMVAEDDKVAVIFKFRGNLVEHNDRELRFTVMGIYYVADGKIIGVKKLNLDQSFDFYTAMGLPRPKD
jgi:predicted ester cyclase